MSKNPIRGREPTYTYLVAEALRVADDFMSKEQLLVAVKCTWKQLRVTLWWLHAKKVIDSIESEGRLWWFYIGNDQRTRTLDLTTHKERPGARKPRAPRHGDQSTPA